MRKTINNLFNIIKGKKHFSNEEKASDKIINSLNTRFLTCTYHRLPEEFHVEYCSYLIRDMIEANLRNSKKSHEIKEIIITKEPYNYEKYPEHKGFMHLHALVVLSKPLRIHSQKTVAKILSFVYNKIEYYPHVSGLHSYKGYLDYITKLQESDPKYREGEYYVKIDDAVASLSLKSELAGMLSTLSNKVINDLIVVLEKYPYEQHVKHMKMIKYVQSLLPNKKTKLEDLLVDIRNLKYKGIDFINSNEYNKLQDFLLPGLVNKNKFSPVVYGDSNVGKSSAIKAIVAEYIEDNKDLSIVMLSIKNIQELANFSNSELSRYDQIILHFDDIDYTEGDLLDKADALKNLFEGPEDKSVLRCLYGTITFTNKMHKIFSMNRDVFTKIQNCIKKYEGLDTRIHPYYALQKIIIEDPNF